jgi:signal transduction histidine kinase
MPGNFQVASGAIGELFWNTSDAVFVCDRGQIAAWNPGAEAILGVTAEEATAPGYDLRQAFGAATEPLQELMAGATASACLDCEGGCGRILEAFSWRLGAGETAPTVVILRDLTDQRRHMLGLERLNALARELLGEMSLDAVLVRIVDAAKELARADFSALVLLREGTEDEIAHFIYNAPRELFPERLPRVVGLLAAPIRSGSIARIEDIRGHPDGVGIPVEHPPIAALLAVPIVVGSRVMGELAVANQPGRPVFDDTDRALVAELAAHAAIALSLATARATQEQVQATRQAILDVALHNIRTPLTVAQGFLATIRTHGSELSDEERDRCFEAIDRAHERIQTLAEGALLGEPTPPGGTLADEGEAIDVSDLGRQLQAELGPYRPEVALEVQIEEGTPSSFLGDHRLVRELLDNLLTNAMKHSPPGETVTVTIRVEGGSMRFDVSDRGPGIAPEEQSRLFDQFYRTAQSVEAGLPGTGLGLWIARRLAQLHGGAVGVSSRLGQGSTFWATFPLEPVRAQPRATPSPAAAAANASTG